MIPKLRLNNLIFLSGILILNFGCSETKNSVSPEDAGLAVVSDDAQQRIDVGFLPDASKSDSSFNPDAATTMDAEPFPEVIDKLTISIRTGTGTHDGTNNNTLGLCLTDSECFVLNVPDVDDFRRGEIDVYHFEGLNLPRSQVDRIQIRSRSGDDRWVPSCMQIQFDGEQVYCNPDINQLFGNDVNEVENWTDPDFLHVSCQTCYEAPITHGPMIGGVLPSSAKIWMRTDTLRKVRLLLHETSGSTRTLSLVTRAENDYAASFSIDGLEPDRTYNYRLSTDNYTSKIYSFKTGPETAATGQFSFAFGSCTKNAEQPIFATIAQTNPDLFLFVGDNHYADSSQLNTLRWYYRNSLEKPERKQLAEEVPTIAVWDDHDFTGNNTNGFAMGKTTALRVFKEYWANPSFGAPQTPGVFFNYVYGDLEFFMLDDRYYRGLDGTLLGQTQTNWLLTQLTSSRAKFKFLVSGSQWTQDGSSDSWGAFSQAFESLFSEIANRRISGVILLSGDVHRSEFRTITRGGTGAYNLFELTSSPMANNNSPCRMSSELRDCFDSGNYFISVNVDTTIEDPSVTARIIAEDGSEMATWTILHSQLKAE